MLLKVISYYRYGADALLWEAYISPGAAQRHLVQLPVPCILHIKDSMLMQLSDITCLMLLKVISYYSKAVSAQPVALHQLVTRFLV